MATKSYVYTPEQIVDILLQHNVWCDIDYIEWLIKNDVLMSIDFYHVSADSLRRYLKNEHNINL